MKVLYDDCLDAIKNDKCSECNDYFQCPVSDYIEQRYQKGRADGISEYDEYWEMQNNRAYMQGRADEREKILTYLVDNGYIKYGFDVEYLEEQLRGGKE